MKTVTVTGSKTYDILIENGAMDCVGEFAAKVVPVGKAMLVTDDTVETMFGERVCTSLEKAGFEVVRYVIPHGEASKNGQQFLNILNEMAERGITRSDTVFALGGGVVGDLAGFAAASYMRGIRLVQIPTTLLAMVDSSVGGKTAIDLPAGKNLVGAFYQPDLVVCDPLAAANLPEVIAADGYAEIIKYGMICDEGLLEIMEGDISTRIGEIIARCVSIKRDIVNEDEHDTGLRQLLNFGHTPAHSIEKCSGFSVTHGHAVAIGMAMMSRACELDCTERLTALLKRYQLPTETDFDGDLLAKAALSDKKRTGGSITLVLPERWGHCGLKKFPVDEIGPYFAKTKEQN